MKKDIVVVFTRNNARILVNPKEGLEYWKSRPNVLVNPMRDHLTGINPAYWVKKIDGTIGIMSDEEKLERDLDIDKHGCDNDIYPKTDHDHRLLLSCARWAIIVATLTAIGFLFLHKWN